ncbi:MULTISPECIES: hypothetical protein [unclassified Streptomyces]|uniref:hypothetical protein n=1 Tax=unclassified Streptomyces TaxID=2593676 RepID=UPI00324A91B5
MADAVAARLVTTLAAPLDRARNTADAPELLHWPDAAPGVGDGRPADGRRLLVQRGDTELIAVDPGDPDAAPVRFPAPWPRRFGTCAVAPRGDLAVFAGVHAVRAVDPTGAVRWEVRHGCWDGSCRTLHSAYEEYAADHRHLYADSGSAVFSADGALVWAHIRGPVAASGPDPEALDEWLIIDAADGRVLGRAETETVAAGSHHVPHPDPARMGLSVGEGQDGVPLRWGRWDGEQLSVEQFCNDERILTGVSPSGDRFVTVTHYEETLGTHRIDDGSVLSELATEHAVPRHPEADPDDRDADETLWDYECGFLDEETLIAGTAERDAEYGEQRHWLVSTAGAELRVAAQVAYPFPISGAPTVLGDGTWYTVSDSGDAVHVWSR